MTPIVLRKKSSAPIIIYDNQVFMKTRQTVGYLRIKLTTRSLIGEKQFFIKGVQVKSIIKQIEKRVTPQDRFSKLDIVLHDVNGRVIRCLKTLATMDLEIMSKALSTPDVKPFLHLNQKVKG